ncbi:transposase [Marinobacterium rhizophilum]|uniref:transposase n=1 Tax=Marinobacterium rhizophilum TaxID=420402 RepID=UPI000A039A01|nr:transposase [Marinobacterium rhizophilum]
MSPVDVTAWIGRSEKAYDEISFGNIQRIAATLSEVRPGWGSPLPPLWQWCFFQKNAPESELGIDGHPTRGGYLPTVENRNRMWAGGRIDFYTPLIIGTAATRVTTIKNAQEKVGKAGNLLFVTVEHKYIQDDIVAIREEQDIVYRDPTPLTLKCSAPIPDADWVEEIKPTSTLLFRYSAITFNSHRIHYDWPYATECEGYPGLVVHAPLIATLTLRAFCRANPEAKLKHFSYRSICPLFSPEPFKLGGTIQSPGRGMIWAGSDTGVAQQGEVIFE